VIFTGISSLLSVRSSFILFSGCIDAQIPQVVMAVRAVQSVIADLFENIKRFFIRLKIYVKLPPTEEMTEIIVDVMVHVLHVLALLTKEIKQGKISELILLIGQFFRLIFGLERFLRKLIGRSDIEDALRRFDKLTQEENRMVTAQNLKTTHGVSEEVTSLRNNVQDVAGGVEGANNKLDVILHGARLVLCDHRYPFNGFSTSSYPIQAQMNLLETKYATGSLPRIYLQISKMQTTPITKVPGSG
jgi:hypothetical protein